MVFAFIDYMSELFVLSEIKGGLINGIDFSVLVKLVSAEMFCSVRTGSM